MEDYQRWAVKTAVRPGYERSAAAARPSGSLFQRQELHLSDSVLDVAVAVVVAVVVVMVDAETPDNSSLND